jgi:hypothetical protein
LALSTTDPRWLTYRTKRNPVSIRQLAIALALTAVTLACSDLSTDATGPAPTSGPNHMIAQCTYPGDPTCTDSLPETNGQIGIAIAGINPSVCADTISYSDSDHDGMNDQCEEKLAEAFAPFLLQSRVPPFFDVASGRSIGDYYHAVRAPKCNANGCDDIRIAYMMAYYFDGGTDGGSGTLDGGHNGDSEFIMIDVRYDAPTTRYVARSVFLSAHCGSTTMGVSTAPSCKWFDATSFTSLGLILGGAPEVWSAKGSNANYRSYSECEGGTYIDNCDRNSAGTRFPVSFDYNVGSYYYSPRNVHARRYPASASASQTESFWIALPFHGWQDTGEGETSYATILGDFGFAVGVVPATAANCEVNNPPISGYSRTPSGTSGIGLRQADAPSRFVATSGC